MKNLLTYLKWCFNPMSGFEGGFVAGLILSGILWLSHYLAGKLS